MDNYKRAGIILICGSEILLVKGKHTGKWSFPKGHKEKNENAFSTAHRELLEETGITIPNYIKYSKIIKYYNGDYVYFVYNIFKKIDSPGIRDHAEVELVKWVNKDDLNSSLYDKNCTLKLFIKQSILK